MFHFLAPRATPKLGYGYTSDIHKLRLLHTSCLNSFKYRIDGLLTHYSLLPCLLNRPCPVPVCAPAPSGALPCAILCLLVWLGSPR